MQGPTTTSQALSKAELAEVSRDFNGARYASPLALEMMRQNLAKPNPRKNKSMFSLNNNLGALVKSATVSTKKTSSNTPTETPA